MTIPRSRARTVSPPTLSSAGASRFGDRAYHRRVIHVPGQAFRLAAPASVRADAVPEIAALRPIDVAEAFRDLPGLALLESARPGRNARWSYLTADPVAVLTEPAAGTDPFAGRAQAADRLASADADARRGADGAARSAAIPRRPRRLPRATSSAMCSSGCRRRRRRPGAARCCGSACTTGRWPGTAGPGGRGSAARALDGDVARLDRRLAEVRAGSFPSARRRGARRSTRIGDQAVPTAPARTSCVHLVARRRGVRGRASRPSAAIAAGEIYQANLTRRLEAPFNADPWPLYRRLRTGDPSLFSAYVDLGHGAPGHGSVNGSAPARPRAILSASPEPFLSVTRDGHVSSDPIKGTRPRGRTPPRTRLSPASCSRRRRIGRRT